MNRSLWATSSPTPGGRGPKVVTGLVATGLALAATLLHESVTPVMLAVTVAVILCVVGARKFAG